MSNLVTLPIIGGASSNWNDRAKYSFDQILSETTKSDLFKSDVTVIPQTMWVNNDGKLVVDKTPHSLTSWGLTQLSARLRIPYSYIKNCPPSLQSKNITYWLKRYPEEDARWFLRSIEKNGERYIRGILSESYSEFNNSEILSILKDVLRGTDGEVVLYRPDEADCGFHLRVAFPNLTTQVGTLQDGSPDLLQVGLHFANSEVGKRSIVVAPLVYRIVCTNGLMHWQVDGDILSQKHIHLNKDEIHEKVVTAVASSLKLGDDLIHKFAESKEIHVDDPMEVIDKLTGHNNTFYFSKKLIEDIKTSYVLEKSGDKDTMYDIVNALTRSAQKLESDRRVTLEKFAHRLLLTA